MCGITGYIGHRGAVYIALDELKRLEYRGYDSAGVAYPHPGGLRILKLAGKIANLTHTLEPGDDTAASAIAHTRWATHGGPTDDNAHPHTDCHRSLAVVHNGIIENYIELTERLQSKGHRFLSETDTEVIAHLIEDELSSGDYDLQEAVRRGVRHLRGSFAIAVICQDAPERIVVARQDSPLVLGKGDNENFIASDIPALLPFTRRVIVLEDGDTASVSSESIAVHDGEGRSIERTEMFVDWDAAAAEKGGYSHFMLKEIHEQPTAIAETLRGRLHGDNTVEFTNLQWTTEEWRAFERIAIVSCGTAYHAGLVGKHVFEKLLRRPVEVHFASEFRYGDPILPPNTLAMVISQSGETADTLAALRMCKSAGVNTLGVVNVVGSSIARECDQVAYTQAGPEISVASTKAYSAQVTMMYLLALHIARIQGAADLDLLRLYGQSLRALPNRMETAMRVEEPIRELATVCRNCPWMFFLGRGLDSAVALEGALKIKEVAYMPTQESPAGEMKHGPLALIEPGVAAVFVATRRSVREKILSNMKEVKARGGMAIAVVYEGEDLLNKVADVVIELPRLDPEFMSAPLAVLPLQLLAYYVALERGCEIDQPRNLAKSVTVE